MEGFDGFDGFDGTVDFNSFINFPEENEESNNISVDFQLDSLSTETPNLSEMQSSPDLDLCQHDLEVDFGDILGDPNNGLINQNSSSADIDMGLPQAEDFRYVIDSWASADSSVRSMKQKRRDAAIDLHLQRFMNIHSDSQLFPTDFDFQYSNTPSTYSHESSQQSPGAGTPASSISNSDQIKGPQVGGRELVFDINLNTATRLPKKQKKRTKAQIQDYINARRNGACLKHKKQHKKCNCHEKAAAKKTVDVKVKKQRVALPNASVPVIVQSPSSPTKSPFSPSTVSSADHVLYDDEIESALASLADLQDLEKWSGLEAQSNTATVSHGQNIQSDPTRFVLPMRHGTFNSFEMPTNSSINVWCLTEPSANDTRFEHLLNFKRNGINHGGLRDYMRDDSTAGIQEISPQLPVTTSTPVFSVPSAFNSDASSSPLLSSSSTASSTTGILPVPSRLLVEKSISTSSVSSATSVSPAAAAVLSATSRTSTISSVSSVYHEIPTPSTSIEAVTTAAAIAAISLSPRTVLPVPPTFMELSHSVLQWLFIELMLLVFQASFNDVRKANTANLGFKGILYSTPLHNLQYCTVFTTAVFAMDYITMILQSIEQIVQIFRSDFYRLAIGQWQRDNLQRGICSREPFSPLNFTRTLLLQL